MIPIEFTKELFGRAPRSFTFHLTKVKWARFSGKECTDGDKNTEGISVPDAGCSSRVEKLKSARKSTQEAVAEKTFADLEAIWARGIIKGEQWVQVVYLTLWLAA